MLERIIYGSPHPKAVQFMTTLVTTFTSKEIPLQERRDMVADTIISPEIKVDNHVAPVGSNLADESIDDAMRPAKKLKPDYPSDDVSDEATSDTSENVLNGSIQVKPDLPTSRDSIDDYCSIIHPSIAEIIKLEDIPSVEPLEYLSIRDTAGKLRFFLRFPLTCSSSHTNTLSMITRARVGIANRRHIQL